MWIEAIIRPEEIGTAIGGLLPLIIHLDDTLPSQRYLVLHASTECALVAGRGLQLACSARLIWSPSITFELDVLRVVIHPSIEMHEGVRVLALQLQIEDSDFAHLPAAVDAGIGYFVSAALASRPVRWDFTSLLTHSLALPERMVPARTADFTVSDAECLVEATLVRLRVSVDLRFADVRAGDASSVAA